jgi:hypothetical protein
MRGLWTVAICLAACGCQSGVYRQLCGGGLSDCAPASISQSRDKRDPGVPCEDERPPAAFPGGAVLREPRSPAPVIEVRQAGQGGTRTETNSPQDVQIDLARQKIVLNGNANGASRSPSNQDCQQPAQPNYQQPMQPYPQAMMGGNMPIMMVPYPYGGMGMASTNEDGAVGGSMALGMRIMRIPFPVPRLFRVPAQPAAPMMMMPMQMPMMGGGMMMPMQMPMMGGGMMMPMQMPMMGGGMMMQPNLAMGGGMMMQPNMGAAVTPTPAANINVNAAVPANVAAAMGMVQANQTMGTNVNVQSGGQLQTRDPAVEELARNLMMLDILLRERAGNPATNATAPNLNPSR